MLFFGMAFGTAYSAQFLFLISLVEAGDVNEYLAQFLGLFIYGTVNFITNKKITFRNKRHVNALLCVGMTDVGALL